MLPVLEEPAIRAQVPAFTIENYHRLFRAGVLPENLELIRGAIVEKMPKSALHAAIVTRLFTKLLLSCPGGHHVRSEQPLTFLDSEPEPDLAIVSGSDESYETDHPKSAAIIMEVVVTSERIDRIKLGIYAEAGVPECWLVLAEERVIERHTEPRGLVYQCVERIQAPASLASTVFPHLVFTTDAIFRA